MLVRNMKAILYTTAAYLAVDGVSAGTTPITCDDISCGTGFVCEMIEPQYCPYASCPPLPQCVPPSTCDDLSCPTGHVCQVHDPPGNCPHCQPVAFCQPQNQGWCPAGEAYNYNTGECVPITCESPNACPDTACHPANPGHADCDYQYTGIPCEYFTCSDYDPCIATTCLVGTICQVNSDGQPECVCDTPTYVFNDFENTCVPNSCDAMNACPEDATCVPGGDPNCQGNCRPYQCVGGSGSCPDGYYFDEYYHACRPDPCEDVTCPVGAVCIHTHSGTVATDCVCDEPLYEYDPHTGECVPTSCMAPTACPAAFQCTDHPNGSYTCSDCEDGYEYVPSEHRCVAVTCEADPCSDGLVCVDIHDDCMYAPCYQYVCQSCGDGYEYDEHLGCVPVADPCALVYCGPGLQCDGGVCCPIGTGFNPDDYVCLPVNCDYPFACPSDKDCVDDDTITCDSDPCAQFTCEDPDSTTDPCAHIPCGADAYCDQGLCCPFGTELNEHSVCIAVSCEAPNACLPSQTCVDDDTINCTTSPCAQFLCESSQEDPCVNPGLDCPEGFVCQSFPTGHGALHPYCVCPENYEFHPAGFCVPQTCDAGDPCPPGKTCYPYDHHCGHPGPCPQYYCH